MKRAALAVGIALTVHASGAALLWRSGTRATSPASRRAIEISAFQTATARAVARPTHALTEVAEETPQKSTPAGVPDISGPTSSELNEIRARIEAQVRYPLSLRRLGIQGSARLAVTLAATGTLEDIRISESSGSADLDRLAVDAVQAAAPFSPGRALSFTLPIEFRTSDSR